MKLIKRMNNVFLETHIHQGVFIVRGLVDCIATINYSLGKSFYGEMLLRVYINKKTFELRVWNPFRSKLAAAILSGLENLRLNQGMSVLYLGSSTGTTLSHISDIIGPNGVIYSVENEEKCLPKLLSLSLNRPNIIPIIEDAHYPNRYRMLVQMVDCIIVDISQKEQAKILAINALFFLKTGGNFVMTLKSASIGTMSCELSFGKEINYLRLLGFNPLEQVTLEPYEKSHCVVTGIFTNINKLLNSSSINKLIN
mmetsp:Transcript_23478/g.32770  ORF Transcript_23478/g.32770 Transcript_23478/m.32770 type:complete len:254 (-) Transcript_23478:646-1407(-)